jgi:hypothetical protein
MCWFNKIFIIILNYLNSFIEPNSNEIKYNIDKYYQILEKIGNYEILNKMDIEFLSILPQNKLVNIIKIYNGSYTETINDLLNKY